MDASERTEREASARATVLGAGARESKEERMASRSRREGVPGRTRGLAERVDALAVRLPDDDPQKGELRKLVASRAGECGCSMGGAFLLGASVIAGVYFAVGGGLNPSSALKALGGVFCVSLIGKAVGIGIARVRLLSLRRTLATKLALLEE
jgi:hypothetical protein